MESQTIEFRAVLSSSLRRVQRPKTSIGAWLMCMVIVAQSIPQWQSAAECKCGRESLEDDPRPGRPADVISQEMIDRVERLEKQSPNRSCRTCFRMWYF